MSETISKPKWASGTEWDGWDCLSSTSTSSALTRKTTTGYSFTLYQFGSVFTLHSYTKSHAADGLYEINSSLMALDKANEIAKYHGGWA